MSVRRSAAVATVLAAALALGGCQDDPEPRFDPSPTDSSSPTDPETSDEPQAQTAEEFIEEWVSLQADMQNSGETEAFLAASTGCKPCRSFAKRIASIYAKGGRVETRGWEVRKLDCVGPSDQTRCDGSIHSHQTRYRESADAVVETLPGGRLRIVFELAQKATGWNMTNTLERES